MSAYLLGLATIPAIVIVVFLASLAPSAWEWIRPHGTVSGCYLCGKTWRKRGARTFWHRWVGCRVARGRKARQRVVDGWSDDERRLRRRQALNVAMESSKWRGGAA